VLAAIERGVEPTARRLPASRTARAASRIAVRQLRQSGADSALLEAWEQTLERPRPADPRRHVASSGDSGENA
jgi:hypothetical protein